MDGGWENFGNCLSFVIVQRLLELAINDEDDEEDEHGDDGDGYDPICSHPALELVCRFERSYRVKRGMKYLRAIPLSVLTLRSTYPSLSNMVALVC